MRSFLPALALILVFAANANALDVCTPKDYANRLHEYLAENARVADGFPDIQKLELPASAIEAIKAHDFSELLAKYPQGKGLAIGVGPEPVRRTYILGEYIQSGFVVKTLKQVFPKATIIQGDFTEGWKAANPNVQAIHLHVVDTAEMGGDKDIILDMPILKAANPSLQALRNFNARGSFGIPPEKLSMSFYLKKMSFGTAEFPDAVTLLQKLKDTRHLPDVVFLTRGGGLDVTPSAGLSIFAEEHQYEIVRLSKLTHPLDPNKKYIVLNDMTGKLPYLDRASNISVRVGPINLFESLAVGTPTLYFQNSEILDSYDPQAFAKMSNIAQKTGGAYPVKDTDAFSKGLVQVLDSPTTPSPPDPEAFDEFLNHLSKLLKRKLLTNKH